MFSRNLNSPIKHDRIFDGHLTWNDLNSKRRKEIGCKEHAKFQPMSDCFFFLGAGNGHVSSSNTELYQACKAATQLANVNVNVNNLLAISKSDFENSGEPRPQAEEVNHLETPLRQRGLLLC